MKVGLEIITVMQDAINDFEGTVKKISDVGYKYVEWLNGNAGEDDGLGFGISVKDAKAVFDANGVKLTGGLIVPKNPVENMATFLDDTETLKRIVDWYASIQCESLGLGIEFFPSMEYIKRRCEAYNKLGKLCKDAGLQFTYHNHYHEWQYLDGELVFDIILENTNPELVGFELDVYWALRALRDSSKLIRESKGRIKLLHTKDFPLNRIDNLNLLKSIDLNKPIGFEDFGAHSEPEDFIEVGQGIIKIQDVIDAGNENNIPYIFVEQDHTKLPPFESIEVTLDAMKKMRGLEWD